jgi:NAD(P)-dependent dehydrogenase (short-subunit alcohol dehydrogenase family)
MKSLYRAGKGGWHTHIFCALAAAVLSAWAPARAADLPAATAAEGPTVVLVTGANRGLGYEFVRQYGARGYRVLATARRPESAVELNALSANNPLITIDTLDVTDLEQIDALAEKYADQPIDILINNAGVTGEPIKTQMFGKIDYSVFDTVMHVNVLAPLKMAEAFYPHVSAGRDKKIITVSSSQGSIAKTFGFGYFYRSSKAAVNMVMATMAKELRRKGIIIGLVNPGPTATDMMKTMGGNMKLRDPAEATADMIRNIDELTIDTSGAFLQYDGSILPW